MSRLTLGELRALSTYTPQDDYLFLGSIGENILFGNPAASKDDMVRAAKLARAFLRDAPLLRRIPDGRMDGETPKGP